ncbi:MAG: Holliday junction resolvase RuvX [Gammaproteobacteria bacterium]|nr:Holliday junction resolvase RuvX [Gammaproteobacteria bacterium]MDH5594838.1 Holliday junction resolvase RuvX [Gammaproteobacteria bacterium]
MNTTSARTILGFDYGEERIGVAVAQEVTATAAPVTTLKTVKGAPDWDGISQLVEQWQPALFIVGLPLNMDGTESNMCKKARRFGNQLNGRYNLDVIWIDERLSSIEAEQIKQDKGAQHQTDEIAAQLILQTWLNENGLHT